MSQHVNAHSELAPDVLVQAEDMLQPGGGGREKRFGALRMTHTIPMNVPATPGQLYLGGLPQTKVVEARVRESCQGPSEQTPVNIPNPIL